MAKEKKSEKSKTRLTLAGHKIPKKKPKGSGFASSVAQHVDALRKKGKM